MANALAAHWTLDPAVTFLNHGSFGACPRQVLAAQTELRAELERQPLAFLARGLYPRLDAAREQLGCFLGASPEDLAFVSNATLGVNTVLKSLPFAPGDELLTTDHAYNACKNALDAVAAAHGAQVVTVAVPFPLLSPDEVVEAVLAGTSPRTRLALLDHVTSPTGLVLPLETLVPALAERGIDTLVDGAHAPGMLPLDLDALGAAYYTGNCHKWLCAPKGAAFLHVRADRQDAIRPLVVSHGANTRRPGRSRFHDELDWVGTQDPTPYLCVPVALDTVGGLLDGGWPAVRSANHELAVAGRRLLTAALDVAAPAPESMLGSLAAVPLPEVAAGATPFGGDPLQVRLWEEYRIEVPVMPGPRPGQRLLRISAMLYNELADYQRLAAALEEIAMAPGGSMASL